MGGVDEIVARVGYPGHVEGVAIDPIPAPNRALLDDQGIVTATDIDPIPD
jgi:hypothetical protein